VVEAMLASTGTDLQVQILGGTTAAPVRHRRIPAMAAGGVAGIGILGAMAAAAALQGTFPLPGHSAQHLPTVAAAPATTTPTTGGALRVIAGKQPPWASALPDLLVTPAVTVPDAAVHEAVARAAAVAEIMPTATTTPPVTTPVTTPDTVPATTTTTSTPITKTPTPIVVIEPTRVVPPTTAVTTTTTVAPTRAVEGDDHDHDHARGPGPHAGPPHPVPAHGLPWQ